MSAISPSHGVISLSLAESVQSGEVLIGTTGPNGHARGRETELSLVKLRGPNRTCSETKSPNRGGIATVRTDATISLVEERLVVRGFLSS